jgi:hypothetical protein
MHALQPAQLARGSLARSSGNRANTRLARNSHSRAPEASMFEESKRAVKEGMTAGLAASVILSSVSAMVAFAFGQSPLLPLQVSASVLLGPDAFSSAAASLVVGPMIVLTFGSWMGVLYGAIAAALKPHLRASWMGEGAIGAAFGLGVYVVTVQLAGGWTYPWMIEGPQFAEALLFAFAYGLPLGLMVALEEKIAARPPEPVTT